ncbi:MAG TPA: hypothetical protein VHU83_02185 [Bryobacteraceae bacterium]|jgi:hypothetical protein|nr:hypothetical protein [Bryobacteraceae bacterium]
MPVPGKSVSDYLPRNQPSDFTLISPFLDFAVNELSLNFEASQTYQIGENDARVQPANCFDGRAISITVRSESNFEPGRAQLPQSATYRLFSGYQPSPKVSNENLNSVHEICRVVYEVLHLDEKDEVHGFLIISGTTNSLKTQLARGLIHFYLEHRMLKWLASKGEQRKPHLVTCEDDIEKYFVELERLVPLETVYQTTDTETGSRNFWLTNPDVPDYTPRKKDKDVGGELDKAVESALRMTPAVFYAGEIRDQKDWKRLYPLAQSHLVVLTAHASGLVNTFEILQRNLEAKSPAQHSELAASVFAVVHMRSGHPLNAISEPPAGEGREIKSVIPACWRNTPMSMSTFTSDGLASLVAGYADLTSMLESAAPDWRAKLPYSVGRRAFAEVLLKLAKQEKQFDGLAAPNPERWKALTKEEKTRFSDSVKAGQKTNLQEIVIPPTKEPVPSRQSAVPLCQCAEERFLRQSTAWDLRGE